MQLEGVNDAAVLNNISSWNLPVNYYVVSTEE